MYEPDFEKDDEKSGDEDHGRGVVESTEGTDGDDEFALLVRILDRSKNLGFVSLIIFLGVCVQ